MHYNFIIVFNDFDDLEFTKKNTNIFLYASKS